MAASVISHHEGVRVNQIKKMLAVPAAIFALWAMNVTAATNDDIAKRLEPVGQVCVQGQECKGMEVAAAAGGGATGPATAQRRQSRPATQAPATPAPQPTFARPEPTPAPEPVTRPQEQPQERPAAPYQPRPAAPDDDLDVPEFLK